MEQSKWVILTSLQSFEPLNLNTSMHIQFHIISMLRYHRYLWSNSKLNNNKSILHLFQLLCGSLLDEEVTPVFNTKRVMLRQHDERDEEENVVEVEVEVRNRVHCLIERDELIRNDGAKNEIRGIQTQDLSISSRPPYPLCHSSS